MDKKSLLRSFGQKKCPEVSRGAKCFSSQIVLFIKRVHETFRQKNAPKLVEALNVLVHSLYFFYGVHETFGQKKAP